MQQTTLSCNVRQATVCLQVEKTVSTDCPHEPFDTIQLTIQAYDPDLSGNVTTIASNAASSSKKCFLSFCEATTICSSQLEIHPIELCQQKSSTPDTRQSATPQIDVSPIYPDHKFCHRTLLPIRYTNCLTSIR